MYLFPISSNSTSGNARAPEHGFVRFTRGRNTSNINNKEEETRHATGCIHRVQRHDHGIWESEVEESHRGNKNCETVPTKIRQKYQEQE
jgi:hypothetical protein